MTPAGHYAEAERVREAIRTPYNASQEGFDGWQRDDLIALAQMHATLALLATYYGCDAQPAAGFGGAA